MKHLRFLLLEEMKVGPTYTGTIYCGRNPNWSAWIINGREYKTVKIDQDWVVEIDYKYFDYSGNIVTSFDEMFESLPPDLQNIIIWNLDIWRLDTTRDLEVK